MVPKWSHIILSNSHANNRLNKIISNHSIFIPEQEPYFINRRFRLCKDLIHINVCLEIQSIRNAFPLNKFLFCNLTILVPIINWVSLWDKNKKRFRAKRRQKNDRFHWRSLNAWEEQMGWPSNSWNCKTAYWRQWILLTWEKWTRKFQVHWEPQFYWSNESSWRRKKRYSKQTQASLLHYQHDLV